MTVLTRLSELSGLDTAPDLPEVIEALHPALDVYAELELRSSGQQIDLITRTKTRSVIEAFLSLAERRGAFVERMAALARFGAGHSMGLKLSVAGALDGAELYVGGALPIAEATAFLERQNAAGVDSIPPMANALRKESLHVLAADSDPSARYTAFLTTYLRPESDDAAVLRPVFDLREVESAGWSTSIGLHRMLGASRPATLFISWPLDGGSAAGRLKLDYESPRVGLMAEAFAATDGDADLLLRLAEADGSGRASYGGVVIGATGPASARAYFARRGRPVAEWLG